MKHNTLHLSDERLLLHIDGELPRHQAKELQSHLDACWICRTRRAELERAIADFVHVHDDSHQEADIPPGDGPRALLKARMAELAKAPALHFAWLRTYQSLAWTAAFILLILGANLIRLGKSRSYAIVASPDSRLTPGATVLVSRLDLCSAPDTKNKAVPATLRKRVFDEYGIAGADPAAYEVDYLVTPALGGADDIHNLWPHSYSATLWNARVKDELEDRLRDMVCGGTIELAAAQQEIASDWIAAYKKYFHTERPLEQYCRRCAP